MENPPLVRSVRVLLMGRVQGVGFRAATRRQAESLALQGWVRNLSGGQVEFVAEGPAGAIEQLLAWSRQGPPSARVDNLQNTEQSPTGQFVGFVVLQSAH